MLIAQLTRDEVTLDLADRLSTESSAILPVFEGKHIFGVDKGSTSGSWY